MKIARFFALIFAGIGTVLLLGSMAFFLLNRNARVRIQHLPQEAVAVSDAFSQALNDGDLETAAKLMYGQPDLGVGMPPESAESACVWDTFRGNISFSYTGNCYVEQSALLRDGSITTLDISTVLGKLPERAQSLMNQKIASAQELSEIYDDDNNFREDLVTEILQEALQQGLTQDAKPVTREVTLKLIHRDGRWWVVPHQNLLQILSGLT